MPRWRREVWLDSENVLDYDVFTDRGAVRAFSPNYRAFVDGAWVTVVRYDTAHGVLHLHRFWRRAHRQVESLGVPLTGDYGEAFRAAEENLRLCWPSYRRRMEAELK